MKIGSVRPCWNNAGTPLSLMHRDLGRLHKTGSVLSLILAKPFKTYAKNNKPTSYIIHREL